jgi:Family of unknown function (DUF5372)
VTHPFHPRAGREYVFVAARLSWGEDRVFFLDEDATQRSLPSAWTDVAAPDAFVVVAAGRSALRVVDLLDLAALLDGLRAPCENGTP